MRDDQWPLESFARSNVHSSARNKDGVALPSSRSAPVLETKEYQQKQTTAFEGKPHSLSTVLYVQITRSESGRYAAMQSATLILSRPTAISPKVSVLFAYLNSNTHRLVLVPPIMSK